MVTKKPVVDLLVSVSPAKSASTKAFIPSFLVIKIYIVIVYS